MADPLSIAANVLTIVSAVKHAVSAASALYGGFFGDLKLLLSDLEDLERAIKTMESCSPELCDMRTLSNAQGVVVQLHQQLIGDLQSRRQNPLFGAITRARQVTNIPAYRKRISELSRALTLNASVAALSLQAQNKQTASQITTCLDRVARQQAKVIDSLHLSASSVFDPAHVTHGMLVNALQNHQHLVVGNPSLFQILITIEETSLSHYRFLATLITEAKANTKLTVVSDVYTPHSGNTRVANVAKLLKILFQGSVNDLGAILRGNKYRWRIVKYSNSEGVEHSPISDSSESQDRMMINRISYLYNDLEFSNTKNQQRLRYKPYLESGLLMRMDACVRSWIDSMEDLCISSMLFFSSVGDIRLKSIVAPRYFTSGMLDRQFIRYQQTSTKSKFYFEPVEKLDSTKVDHVKGVSYILEDC